MGLDNPLHIAFLLIVLLLVFGAKRLPEMGRSLGAGMREFKESLTTQTTQTGESTQTTQSNQSSLTAPKQEPAPVAVNAQGQILTPTPVGEQPASGE
jgi:sec-independent protein translocase protein TatA